MLIKSKLNPCLICVGISIILFAASAQSKELLDCREGWLSTDESCYKLFNFDESWDDAQTMCQAEQASLLVVQNDKERQWLMSQMANYTNTRTWWLGLSGIDKFQKWNTSVVHTDYTVPFADEPDNAEGKENCVMITGRGFLRDEDCSSVASFICKAKKPTTDYDCKTTSYSGMASDTSSHCYWFNIVNGKSWSYAQRFCKAIDIPNGRADLLSIESTLELKSVQKFLASFTTEGNGWWTGLNDKRIESSYQYSDGAQYSASNVQWLTKKNAIASGDKCWVLLSSGKATLFSCDSFVRPICKHSRIRDTSSQCPPYWRREGDSCYLFGEQLTTWKGAIQKCQSLGGRSLKTNSEKERAWLETTTAFSRYGHEYWTSLRKDNVESDKFAWWDGNKPSKSSTPVKSSLVKWDTSLHSSSRCMVGLLGPKGLSGSYRGCNSTVSNVACEYTLKPQASCLAGWIQFMTKCYYISEGSERQEHNWIEAKKVCNDILLEKESHTDDIVAHYITIENDKQLDFVSSAVRNLNSSSQKIIWLGLNSIDEINEWVWDGAVDVSPATIYFNNFKQPNPFYDCAVITHGGRYRTKYCEEKYFYLCEKAKTAAGSTFSNVSFLTQAFYLCSSFLLVKLA